MASKRAEIWVAMIAAAGLTISGCSGGGGSPATPVTNPPAPPPPPPPPQSGPTFSNGVFEPSSTFENLCEAPRSGVDIEGNAFPDQPGSLLEELFWLRSWTNETYLFNDEVTDRDPNDFDDRLEYFAQLRTFATTPSGEDRDDFHFSQPTEEFLESRNSAPSSGYGVRLAFLQSAPPRDLRVVFTEPGSPAAEIVNGRANFERGERLFSINGIDVINGSDVNGLNAGLSPPNAGTTTVFELGNPDGTGIRSVSVTSANIASQPVNRTSIISTSSGDVGYILFNTFSPFSSEAQIAQAIQDLDTAGVDDLVLDLRYNGGGLLAVAAQVGYMIAGDAATQNRVFEQLRYNNCDNPNCNDPIFGNPNSPIPFIDTGQGFSLAVGTPLPALDLDRVFILSTEGTCSASEAVINGLNGIGIEVILIGDTTCGKPFGFFPTDNCGETYFTIQFQGTNDIGFGDYTDGFLPANSTDPLVAFGEIQPGCQVVDNLTGVLGDENEPLLATALQFREDGTCPAPPVSVTIGATVQSVTGTAIGLDPAMMLTPPARSIFEDNRDMRLTPFAADES
ncbi:MAG: S41 family peptidase [Pseudomonadota bacterium]